MTYQDISAFKRNEPTGLAKGYAPDFLQKEFCYSGKTVEQLQELVNRDLALFEQIEKGLLNIKKPQDGDYVEYAEGNYARISRIHPNGNMQISNKIGVFVWTEGADASGCTWDPDLDHVSRERLTLNNLTLKSEIRKASCWTFSGNIAGGGRGVHFEINFKVWTLK